jgi:hypothetical protein
MDEVVAQICNGRGQTAGPSEWLIRQYWKDHGIDFQGPKPVKDAIRYGAMERFTDVLR